MKKTWETPKLIALVRNNPQEAVLSGCKYMAYVTGPANMDNVCLLNPYPGGGCVDRCNEMVES